MMILTQISYLISLAFTDLDSVNPDLLVYGGIIGLFLGLIFLLFFVVRRIQWILHIFSREKRVSPGLVRSLRNLIFILLWGSVFGMLLFLGAFLQAYYRFTLEEPVAEILLNPANGAKTHQVTLVQYISPDSLLTRNFTIKGDQWVLEGDILKWDNWLNFIGLHTRYRLTRLRGRYLSTEEEIKNKPTIYALSKKENDPLWRYLYQFGQRLPFVSSVYGNAVFQTSGENREYMVYVSTSGFLVRAGDGEREEDAKIE